MALPQRVYYFESTQATKDEKMEIEVYLDRLNKHIPVSYNFDPDTFELIYKELISEVSECFTFQGRLGIITGLKALLDRVEPQQQPLQ